MRSASAAGRLWRGERGQVFAFVATILFGMFLFAAASINIGQAVTRRILLQMTADAGAFTGATVMAQGLNTIAQQNLRIQRAWGAMATATAAFTLPPCLASDMGTAFYGVASGRLAYMIRRLNTAYGQRASAEARQVTEYNAVDLFPSERLAMGESHGPSGIRRQRPDGRLVDLEQVPHGTMVAPGVASPTPGYRQWTWSCLSIPALEPRTGVFQLWYRAKRSSMPMAFVWTVTAPATSARAFDTFFGPMAIPEMTAAAVARPVGGEIALGRSLYVAKMTPLRNVVARVYDSYFRRQRSVSH
jgi:hypothetical protein